MAYIGGFNHNGFDIARMTGNVFELCSYPAPFKRV
jgi:hypothetical protein